MVDSVGDEFLESECSDYGVRTMNKNGEEQTVQFLVKEREFSKENVCFKTPDMLTPSGHDTHLTP